MGFLSLVIHTVFLHRFGLELHQFSLALLYGLFILNLQVFNFSLFIIQLTLGVALFLYSAILSRAILLSFNVKVLLKLVFAEVQLVYLLVLDK